MKVLCPSVDFLLLLFYALLSHQILPAAEIVARQPIPVCEHVCPPDIRVSVSVRVGVGVRVQHSCRFSASSSASQICRCVSSRFALRASSISLCILSSCSMSSHRPLFVASGARGVPPLDCVDVPGEGIVCVLGESSFSLFLCAYLAGESPSKGSADGLTGTVFACDFTSGDFTGVVSGDDITGGFAGVICPLWLSDFTGDDFTGDFAGAICTEIRVEIIRSGLRSDWLRYGWLRYGWLRSSHQG